MYLFVDGQPVILTFDQVEQIYYQFFVREFGSISLTQWRGSYEYQALYPAMQASVENGILTDRAITAQLQALADANEQLKRPAVLVSRVPERFAEVGYVATIREATLATAGIVAICVDYERNVIHNERSLTVGNNGTVIYGYNSGSYGALDKNFFDGLEIQFFHTNSDYLSPTRIITADDLPFPNHLTQVEIVFAGYSSTPQIFTWDIATTAYINAVTGLADWIAGKDTLAMPFYFTADDTTDAAEQDEFIKDLIALEMLPAGQFMEGDIFGDYVLSNGQTITIQWSTPTIHNVDWNYTITRDRNSSFPVDDVDTIVAKFNANFLAQNPLGNDITPDTYLTTADLPWAAKIAATYSIDGAPFTDAIYQATFDQKFISVLQPADVVIV
jgi:hypothetical protein